MRTPRVFWIFSALSALLALEGRALATPNFPPALETYLNLSYQPPCALCHEGGKTGKGTVNTPFGSSMRARGLVAEDENSLATALGKMMDDKVDSDGDGVTDIDELIANTDPNTAGTGSLGENTPQYGCGAEIAPGGPAPGHSVALTAAALVAASLGARLRRIRARRRRSG